MWFLRQTFICLFITVLSLGPFFGYISFLASVHAESQSEIEEELFSGYWLVKFEENVTETEQLETVLQYGAEVVEVLRRSNGILIKLGDTEAREQLAGSEGVLYLKRDAVVTVDKSNISKNFLAQLGASVTDEPASRPMLVVIDAAGEHSDLVRAVVDSEVGTDVDKKAVVLETIEGTNGSNFSNSLVVESYYDVIAMEGSEKAVVNASYSNRHFLDEEEREAIGKLVDKGAVLVTSAGNSGFLASPAYSQDRMQYWENQTGVPMDYAAFANPIGTLDGVTTVGGLSDDGALPDDVTSGVFSPSNHPDFYAAHRSVDGGQIGTSFAAPRVSAAYANISSQEPNPGVYDKDNDGDWDESELKERLRDGIANGEFPGIKDGEEVYKDMESRLHSLGYEYNVATDEWISEEGDHRFPAQSYRPDLIPQELKDALNIVQNADGEYVQKRETGDTVGSPATNSTDSANGTGNEDNASTGQQPSDPGGIVSCSGPGDCDACALVTLGQNILNFLVALSVFVAVVAFTYAGFLMVTAAGNETQVTKAKSTFSTVAIGFIIVLAAWLIINLLLSVLTGKGVESWTGVLCG